MVPWCYGKPVACAHDKHSKQLGRPVLVGFLAIMYQPLLIGLCAAQWAAAGLGKSAMQNMHKSILLPHGVYMSADATELIVLGP